MSRALSTPYSEVERKALRRLYPNASREQVLAALPGRSWDGIQHQARDLKLRRKHPGQRGKNGQWSDEHIAILTAHYATQGAAYVGNLVGRAPGTVTAQACKLKLNRVRPLPAPKQHSPVPKAKNTLRPMQVGAKLEAPAPTKRSPNTPNLNARVEARLRESHKKKAVSIIDQIKHLPADSEGRKVYAIAARNGGPAGTAAFLAWQKQQAA